jgi:carboxyl-terminal processing protease
VAPLRGQASPYEQLQSFSTVMNYIRLNYVDSVTYARLVNAAIDGMLRSLDPHSYLLPRDDWERFTAWEQGRFVTAGLFLESEGDAVAVETVVPDSPADRAGVLPGDRLLTVDGVAIIGLPLQTVQGRLLGEKGSKVRLTLERGSRLEPDTFSVTLKRSATPVGSTATARLVDRVTGYVRLQDFKLGAGQDVHRALEALHGQGGRQVILDLRSNPGGSVPAAAEVASEFLPAGTVVFRMKGRKAGASRDFSTERGGAFPDVPLVVLINRGTASAAEALAACLQDHDRALVLGRRSFGKALAQVPLPLPTGDVVMLTIARIVSPSGRIIQRQYQGLAYERYLSLAGDSGDPHDETFTTDHGRSVRGGGGVMPDVLLPGGPPRPGWLTVAMDSGFDDAVADSVARTMPGAQLDHWIDGSDEWRERLVPPFLSRVRSSLHVAARSDSALEATLARLLAGRVAEVKWGADAYDRFMLHNDPDIRAAETYFPQLRELLSGAK